MLFLAKKETNFIFRIHLNLMGRPREEFRKYLIKSIRLIVGNQGSKHCWEGEGVEIRGYEPINRSIKGRE